MKIGLIDVDGRNKFPNIALMKISAYHKSKGDEVGWYSHFEGQYDRVYLSKVFSFTNDFNEPINAKEVIRGGQDTASNLSVAKRCSTRRKTTNSPILLSISTLTIHSILD